MSQAATILGVWSRYGRRFRAGRGRDRTDFSLIRIAGLAFAARAVDATRLLRAGVLCCGHSPRQPSACSSEKLSSYASRTQRTPGCERRAPDPVCGYRLVLQTQLIPSIRSSREVDHHPAVDVAGIMRCPQGGVPARAE